MKTHLTMKSFSELSTGGIPGSDSIQPISNNPANSPLAGSREQSRSQVRQSDLLKPVKEILHRYEAPFNVSLDSAAFGKDKEVTLTGEGQCAKCALHETKTCQNTVTVEEHGKKVTYYLTQNKVSKDFHDQICDAPAKITATGTLKEAQGRMELTPTKIELIK